jgi:hypothetical protein
MDLDLPVEYFEVLRLSGKRDREQPRHQQANACPMHSLVEIQLLVEAVWVKCRYNEYENPLIFPSVRSLTSSAPK